MKIKNENVIFKYLIKYVWLIIKLVKKISILRQTMYMCENKTI